MTLAGVEPPELDVLRDRDGRLKLGGLTEERQQRVPFAKDARHLIHHAAGCPGDEILTLLAQERERARLERNPEGRRRRVHARGFDGRRGAHALALWHL